MRDRPKIETILTRRFPGAAISQIAAAANAIIGMGEEWEEIPERHVAEEAREGGRGAELRLFRRRESSA